MILKENIPVYEELYYRELDRTEPKPLDTETLRHFYKLNDIIVKFNTPLSLNQAILLNEYETKVLNRLITLYERLFKEKLSYISNDFKYSYDYIKPLFMDMEIKPKAIKELVNPYSNPYVREFRILQSELKAIDNIINSSKEVLLWLL